MSGGHARILMNVIRLWRHKIFYECTQLLVSIDGSCTKSDNDNLGSSAPYTCNYLQYKKALCCNVYE